MRLNSFTLIEGLIVVAIVVVLAAIAMPLYEDLESQAPPLRASAASLSFHPLPFSGSH